jgi:SOS-response transcriptional repressor LexA
MALGRKELTELTELLEVDAADSRIIELKKRVIDALGEARKMRPLIDRQCENREQTHCHACNSEAGCLILNGIIYLDLRELESAIRELEKANRHFSNENEILNHIVGLTLLGSTYQENRKDHQALRQFEKAYQTIHDTYLQIHKHDYKRVEDVQPLINHLKEKIQELSFPDLPPAAPPAENALQDYLALFSIPIFGKVQAGENGKLHIQSSDKYTIVNTVELEGKMFEVHNLHRTSSTDRRITVTANRAHGWLQVRGLSMNGCEIPFDENDYVLFYEASIASHLNYVIASNRDPSGEMALMVKRYDEKNNQLLSKSKDTSKPYDPIQLDTDHQIIGIVIAIAKPVQ